MLTTFFLIMIAAITGIIFNHLFICFVFLSSYNYIQHVGNFIFSIYIFFSLSLAEKNMIVVDLYHYVKYVHMRDFYDKLLVFKL